MSPLPCWWYVQFRDDRPPLDGFDPVEGCSSFRPLLGIEDKVKALVVLSRKTSPIVVELPEGAKVEVFIRRTIIQDMGTGETRPGPSIQFFGYALGETCRFVAVGPEGDVSWHDER